MTTDSNPTPAASAAVDANVDARPAKLLHLPGLIAVSFYMFLLATVVTLYVVQGRVGPLFLIFPVLFIAAALGLLFLLRWAWAFALAAVALLSGLFFWTSVAQHIPYFLVHGVLNLVIFLYLVRAQVRSKLR